MSINDIRKHVDECIEKSFCSSCGRAVTEDDFSDELSKTEYRISALCQQCQDSVFK